MTPSELRSQVITFLEQELVGPDPVPPHVQPNGEEILTSDPPRLRYGAGILFPQAVEAEKAINEVPELPEAVAEAPSTDDVPILDGDEVDLEAEKSSGSTETPIVGDEAVAAANAFLPSAIGLSCLIELPDGDIEAVVSGATYKRVQVEEKGSDGVVRKRDHFHREAFEKSVSVPAASLGGPIVVKEPRAIQTGAGAGLSVEFLSRPQASELGQVRRLLTVTVINKNRNEGSTPPNELCFFQVKLCVKSSSGAGCFLEYPDQPTTPGDQEEAQAALLYRHRKTYAVGHGAAADWTEYGEDRAIRLETAILPSYEIKPIVPTQFGDLKLDMTRLASKANEADTYATLSGLCDRYEKWINECAAEVLSDSFPPKHAEAAEINLVNCRMCLERMRTGIEVLKHDQYALTAFLLMNKTMLQQQLHYALPLREWTGPGPADIPSVTWPNLNSPPSGKGSWYPFQLAFVLLNIRAMTSPPEGADSTGYVAERGIVDLIWFPTGGGKTEAYLGLTAYAILLRRLRNPKDAGTTVLMRYTLRLLTAQQFQRAASLICALELLRRAEPDKFGEIPISIGLWVGELTPNNRADATRKLNKMAEDGKEENPFVMLKCPWCGAQFGRRAFKGFAQIDGYYRDPKGATVMFRCPDQACKFSGSHRLPLSVIDEDLYQKPPTLLFGTVDKFAMLPWRPEAHTFFGSQTANISPPELIIQDELHLISGPLGSMVGHYETIIHELCMREYRGIRLGPKIVASTATISRASEQCHALYNCGPANVQQFPPQALKSGESFFAKEDSEGAGRLYVGVSAPALSSYVTAQVRVLAALLQAPLSADAGDEKERDPCWTLMAYFNNLRVLGHAVTLVRADIPEHMGVIRFRKGIIKPEDGSFDRRRFINNLLELTSRESSSRISAALQRLDRSYPSTGNESAVDICLATNMISVGLDVPRLGIMAVVGQPKTTAEYIQATSRVGRRTPGLVITLYHPGKPRDRSHYEHFRSYHQSIYRYVEPTSVTPFAPPVRDRALHALLITLIRQRGSAENESSPQPMPDIDVLDYVRNIVSERSLGVDPGEHADTLEELNEKIAHWRNVLPSKYGQPGGPAPDILPMMYPSGSAPLAEWSERSWKTPTSMRDVDAECEAATLGKYPLP